MKKIIYKIKNVFYCLTFCPNFIHKLLVIFYAFLYVLSLRFAFPFYIKIKNEYGDFLIKYVDSFSILCPQYEKKLIPYFFINEGNFIDIGAHIGKYSIMVGKRLKNGKVISIEPMPENFELLKKNIEINNLKNIILVNKACYSKKGKMKIYHHYSTCHSLEIKGKKYTIINADTLDNILKKIKINKVTLMKIDVEGVEDEVLKGAIKTLKKHHPKIIFEAWNKKYLNRVKAVLEPFNYKIKKIDNSNYFAY